MWVPRCEWGDELIEQLVSFPAGKRDDKVDVCGLFGRVLGETYGPRSITPEQRRKPDPYGDDDEDEDNWKTA